MGQLSAPDLECRLREQAAVNLWAAPMTEASFRAKSAICWPDSCLSPVEIRGKVGNVDRLLVLFPQRDAQKPGCGSDVLVPQFLRNGASKPSETALCFHFAL